LVEGIGEGFELGIFVGITLGCLEGLVVGSLEVGNALGWSDGFVVGFTDGTVEGGLEMHRICFAHSNSERISSSFERRIHCVLDGHSRSTSALNMMASMFSEEKSQRFPVKGVPKSKSIEKRSMSLEVEIQEGFPLETTSRRV